MTMSAPNLSTGTLLLILAMVLGWPGAIVGMTLLVFLVGRLPESGWPVLTIIMWACSIAGMFVHYRLWCWLLAWLRS